MKLSKKIFFIFLLVTLAFYAGCDSDSDDEDTDVLISGYTNTEEPIHGATISLHTPDGQLILEYMDETQENGTFIVSVPQRKIENGYRIEVTGGKSESGIPFTETLRAVGFTGDETEEIIHIGFASTLLTGYLDRHPDINFEKAQLKVSEFLGIPSSQNLQKSIQHVLSDNVFAREASMNGGVDFFIESLLDEMDSDDQNVHSFAPPHAVQSFKSDLMKSFVKGIVTGVGGKAGGRATGWVMDSIFGSDGPSPPDPAVLEEIQTIGNQVEELKQDLEAFKQAMTKGLEKNEYLNIVQPIQQETGWLDTIQSRYIFLCQKINADNDNDWEEFATRLKADLDTTRLETFLNNTRKAMIGDPNSAIRVWGKLQMSDAIDEKRHQQVFNQFQKWLYYQVFALNLLVEVSHQRGGTDMDYAQTCVDRFEEGIKKQADIFLESVEGVMLISHRTYNPIHETGHGPYGDEWDVDKNGLRPLPNEDYKPETLAQADEIVGSSLGLDKSITVRLATYHLVKGVPAVSTIKDVPITLIGEGGGEYKPDSVTLNRFDQQKDIQDEYGNHLIWDLKRYFFYNLPDSDDSYTFNLKDINPNWPGPYKFPKALIYKYYLETDISYSLDEYNGIFVHAWSGWQ